MWASPSFPPTPLPLCSPPPPPRAFTHVAQAYQTIHGVMRIQGTTFADFQGGSACGGAGVYAIGNHVQAPDAFHP